MASRIRLALADGSPVPMWAAVLSAGVLAAMVGLMTVKLGSLQHQLKALVIVAAALTVVVAALSPEIGLAVLLALMPLRLPFYGTSSDQVLLLLLPAVLVWRIRLRAIPAWALFGGSALAVGGLLAAIGAQDPGIALERAWEWFAAIVAFFVAFSVLQGRREAAQRMIDIFLASAVIVAIFGFLQKAGVHAIVGPPYTPGAPNSFLAFYTVYAGYLAIAATLATGEVVAAIDERRVLRASIFGVVLVLMLAALASTTSRGGLIALGVSWLTLLVLNLRRASVFARVVIILVVFTAAAYAVTPESTIVKLEHRIAVSNGRLSEDQTRSALHRAGEQALLTHPFGLGYGNFSHFLNSSVRNAKIGQAFFHAHETPVEIGLDAGWLGLIGFLTLFSAPFVLTMRGRRGGAQRTRATACAAALAGLMAQGLYDYLFYDNAFLVIFLTLVWGTSHALSSGEPKTRSAEEATDVSQSMARAAREPLAGTAPAWIPGRGGAQAS